MSKSESTSGSVQSNAPFRMNSPKPPNPFGASGLLRMDLSTTTRAERRREFKWTESKRCRMTANCPLTGMSLAYWANAVRPALPGIGLLARLASSRERQAEVPLVIERSRGARLRCSRRIDDGPNLQLAWSASLQQAAGARSRNRGDTEKRETTQRADPCPPLDSRLRIAFSFFADRLRPWPGRPAATAVARRRTGGCRDTLPPARPR